MSHLSLETLARLVDEAPSGIESAHLELCAACRSELEQMRADVTALAALPALVPPPDSWPSLEERLAAEGLVRRSRGWSSAGWLQLAAGIVLFAVGTGVGALVLAPQTLGGEPSAVAVTDPTGAAVAPAAPAEGDARLIGGPGPMPEPAEPTGRREPAATTSPERNERVTPRPQPAPRNDAVRFVANETAPPRNAEEALAFMRRAEATYLEALTLYAEMAGGFEGGDPAARLAALEGIMLTTRAALGVAPADPIINGYHMTALAQRDATLRQLAANSSQSWF